MIIVDYIPEIPPFHEIGRAVLAMYKYLIECGILQKVSFKYVVVDNQPQFAFDTANLEAYKQQMLASGIPNAELAVKELTAVKYQPCLYCGGVSLMNSMLTYRDFTNGYGGSIGRDWECARCQLRWYSKLCEIEEYSRSHQDVKEVISKYWNDFGERTDFSW